MVSLPCYCSRQCVSPSRGGGAHPVRRDVRRGRPTMRTMTQTLNTTAGRRFAVALAWALVLSCTTWLFAGYTVDRRDRSRMTVHEWGTFTALQAEDGRAIAGINTDDEP